jgi:hypothetical protein
VVLTERQHFRDHVLDYVHALAHYVAQLASREFCNELEPDVRLALRAYCASHAASLPTYRAAPPFAPAASARARSLVHARVRTFACSGCSSSGWSGTAPAGCAAHSSLSPTGCR